MELLIVIVVIAILATITIVAFNGIQDQARDAAVASTLSQARKSLETEKVKGGADTYPASLAGVSLPSDFTYTYQRQNTIDGEGKGYCLTATKDGVSTFTTAASQITGSGSCEGLVGWWNLNGNARDGSGYANNGTVSGATLVTGQNGSLSSAYSFNGSGDFIELAKTIALPTASGTISLWVQTSNAGVQNFFYYGHDGEDGCTGFPAVSFATCNMVLQDQSSTQFLDMPSVTDGQWHHLVATWDSPTRTGTIYRDGQQTFTKTLAAGVGTIDQAVQRIGRPGSASRYTNGSLDDIRVYNRSLSAAEVEALHKAGAQ